MSSGEGQIAKGDSFPYPQEKEAVFRTVAGVYIIRPYGDGIEVEIDGEIVYRYDADKEEEVL